MPDLGDRAEDSTIDFTFHTVNASGVPATLGGSPAISIYKANGTTQSTAGVTLTADFDSVTGLNHVRIDTSADAFYATGEDYSVVITTGTVNSVSVVGATVGSFSIENRFMRGTDSANTTTPPTASNIAAAVEAAILDEGDATALLAAISAKVEEFLINEGDATATLAAAATAMRVEMDSNSTQLAAIVEDTNELQTNQGNWLTATGFAVAGDEMDLIDAPNSTAITAFVTALLAGTGDTGITLAKGLEMIAALAAGKVTASSNAGVTTLTYKKRDGSTTSFTTVVTESDKTRATTGALS